MAPPSGRGVSPRLAARRRRSLASTAPLPVKARCALAALDLDGEPLGRCWPLVTGHAGCPARKRDRLCLGALVTRRPGGQGVPWNRWNLVSGTPRGCLERSGSPRVAARSAEEGRRPSARSRLAGFGWFRVLRWGPSPGGGCFSGRRGPRPARVLPAGGARPLRTARQFVNHGLRGERTLDLMPAPLSAKEQLRQALELGHEPFLDRRTFAEAGVPPKIRLRCSCGYESTWRRSEKAALGALVWHLGKVLGESDARDAEMRRNGVRLRQNPAS